MKLGVKRNIFEEFYEFLLLVFSSHFQEQRIFKRVYLLDLLKLYE
ncbi:hypothetical protein AusDCA_3446 [Desulfitobacterium sp. AusDCA]